MGWLVWFGFNAGSLLRFDVKIIPIVINTILAGCSGLITVVTIYLLNNKKVDGFMVVNGLLSGLVAVTAGCHLYHSFLAVVVGIIGAITMFIGHNYLLRFRLDNALSVIPVHGFAGVAGTLFVSFATDGNDNESTILMRLCVQVLGVVFAFSFGHLVLVLH